MKRLMLLVSCASICFSISAQEIGRMVPNSVDIRSIGMGKTEVAGKLGSNAIFSNPSLLALQEKGSIKLGTMLSFGFIKDDYIEEYIEENDDYDVKYGYKPSFKFTNVSAAIPIHIDLPSAPLSLAFGVGYQNAINMSYAKYSKIESSEDDYLVESKNKYTGGLNTVSPGLAIGLFDRISAGMSLNIGFSRIRSKSTNTETDMDGYENESEYTSTTPGSSFYPTFGFSGKPLENLTIGVSITPSYEWEWEETEQESEVNGEDEESDILGGEFTMPLKFSVGLEYQVSPEFAFAIEYQTRPFESFEFDADRSEATQGNLYSTESNIKSMDLKNGHVLHVGAEITAGTVPVRLGFFLEPYPNTNQEVKGSTVDVVEKPNYIFGGTFGLGIPVSEAVSIDAAAQYGFAKTITVYADPDETGFKEYDHKEHLLRVDLGVCINLPTISTKAITSTDNKNTSSPAPQINNTNQTQYNSTTTEPSWNSQPAYQSNQNSSPAEGTYESPYSTPPVDNSTLPSSDTTIENQESGY